MDSIAQLYQSPVDHTKLKRMVENYLDLTRDNATLAQRDRDFYDGDQLSADEIHTLKERGQPPVVTNKIAPAISGLLGIVDAGVSDPEAFPRSPSCQDSADVATKTLRYLADKVHYKTVRANTSENFIIEGIAAAITDWDGHEITLQRVRWEDLIYDPLSREHDFSDAKFMGVAKLLDAEDVEQMFPETYAALGKPKSDFGDFFDEKSKARWWGIPSRNQVRVVDLYYLSGYDWHRAIFVESGPLYSGKSIFLDDHRQTICPIEAASYEVSRRGDRYGAIRNMIDLQKAVNARHGRLLHLTNSRQTQQTDMMAAATDKSIARKQAAMADGVIPFGYAPIQAPDLAQGQMLILQKNEADLDRMAPTPAVLGNITAGSESGRARQLLQQAGYTELARYFGRFENFELRLFRQLWLAAKQFLSAPMMIRIVDDPRAIEFMNVNEPVLGMVAKPALDPTTGQPMINPMTGQPHVVMQQGVVGMKNRLAELDMDIILSTVPDSTTLEQEVFDKVMETMGSLGIAPGDPRLIPMLELIPLPDKRKTIERFKQSISEAQQESAGQQQAMQQAAQQNAQIEQQATAAKTAKDAAHAQKTSVETQRLQIENEAFIQGSILNHAYGHQPPNLWQ